MKRFHKSKNIQLYYRNPVFAFYFKSNASLLTGKRIPKQAPCFSGISAPSTSKLDQATLNLIHSVVTITVHALLVTIDGRSLARLFISSKVGSEEVIWCSS